jgi:hypothetical protein
VRIFSDNVEWKHKERKKKQKRKKRGGLWKLPQPWKSEKVAFGDLFLTISTAAWKSLRTKRSAFPQLPQALRPLTIKRDHSQFPCLTEGVQST